MSSRRRRRADDPGPAGQPGGICQKESGFALIAALLAIWILTAFGLLVFTVTTQDVRISSRVVGEKKAFYATEAGIHSLTQVFNPLNLRRLQRQMSPLMRVIHLPNIR